MTDEERMDTFMTGWDGNLFRLLPAAAMMFVTGGLYAGQKKKNSASALCCKAGTTLIAVLTAFYGAYTTKETQAWLVLAATVCCMAADVLLELMFTAGTAVFGIAHLIYMTSYLQWGHLSAEWGVFCLLLFAGMYLVHKGVLPRQRKKRILGCLYGFLLCAMTAMAVNLALQQKKEGSVLTAVGAVCFFASDNMLIRRKLTGEGRKLLDRILLFLYYSAVFLIAAGQAV